MGTESRETLGCYDVGLVDQWGGAGVDGAEDVAPAEALGFLVHSRSLCDYDTQVSYPLLLILFAGSDLLH